MKLVSSRLFEAYAKTLNEYIEHLRNESFECWSEDAVNGYKTALKSIEVKINEQYEEMMAEVNKTDIPSVEELDKIYGPPPTIEDF